MLVLALSSTVAWAQDLRPINEAVTEVPWQDLEVTVGNVRLQIGVTSWDAEAGGFLWQDARPKSIVLRDPWHPERSGNIRLTLPRDQSSLECIRQQSELLEAYSVTYREQLRSLGITEVSLRLNRNSASAGILAFADGPSTAFTNRRAIDNEIPMQVSAWEKRSDDGRSAGTAVLLDFVLTSRGCVPFSSQQIYSELQRWKEQKSKADLGALAGAATRRSLTFTGELMNLSSTSLSPLKSKKVKAKASPATSNSEVTAPPSESSSAAPAEHIGVHGGRGEASVEVPGAPRPGP